ncbi:MAG: AMP-binding protein [Candidatus Omnitrophica bacterium]|nr:AMP-binding protein [Candidatus Omnitrophota bacterium]
MDFSELLNRQTKQYSDKTAIIFRESRVSFKELRDASFKVAAGLSHLKISRSEKVAIFLPNIPEYIFSFLGIYLLRGVSVPLDFMLTEEEITNFIRHSESKVLIAQEKRGIDFNNIRSKCPTLKKIIIFGQSGPAISGKEGFLPWDGFLKESQSSSLSAEVNEKDHSSIFYTSGSTGHPKGVLLNYGHLKNPIECFEYFLSLTDKDVLMCAGVPFSHLGGLDHLLLMLYFGVTLVLMERFQPLEFLKNIEKHKVTLFCIVPSMYVAVLSLKEYDKFDLSSLRYAVVFGAPSSPVLLERFHKACPNAYLLNGWGMTETSAPNTYLPTGTNTKEIPNTGKFPPGTEAKLVDDKGGPLGDEKDGELLIRGKCVMCGYYKEPELTKQAVTKDGWLCTGDIARRDKLGRYAIVGRKKEMIKVSGEIVFCPEVEEVIHRHPKVGEVAVIGVPDKLRGELPKAFIVLKEGENSSEEELRYFLREHLAHFKIPHYFEFISELPKNRVGKIDKEKLRQG